MTGDCDALVIGGGPAGLMAAERLLARGHGVTLADAMPTVGRKLLMAGKSGLNLTKDEPFTRFLTAYGSEADWLRPALEGFGPAEVQEWARGLGQEVFTGSSGRVFPRAMKASPLLRAWLARLRGQGLEIRARHRWRGFGRGKALFDTPEGRLEISARAVVLALGGASWSRLGSDGAWSEILAGAGVPLAPFQPANMGFEMDWSAHMAPFLGQPVKPLTLIAGPQRVRGEVVISARGLEGGGIYAVSRALREGARLELDLIPDIPAERAAARMAARPAKEPAAQALRRALGLEGARLALAMEFGRPWPTEAGARAARVKALPVPLGPPRPLDEAISTAGGIRAEGLTENLMLRALPGVFAAGEMLDWEAPTGGYLLTACLATGRQAGESAAAWIEAGRWTAPA